MSSCLRNSTAVVIGLALLIAACANPSAGEEGLATETTVHDHDQEHLPAAATDGLREWIGSLPPVVTLALSDSLVLDITAPGFTFTSANVIDPVPGEGHAHLYVDGDLVTMIYKPTYPLPRLEPGAHELTVTLSTNDHLEYSSGGKPIAGTTRVEIPQPEAMVVEVLAPEVVEITLTIVEGHLQEHLHLVAVPVGATVRLAITSDVDDEIHIRGYGIAHPVTADVPTEVEFVADIPGLFDVEFEHSGGHLIQFEVG